MINRKLFALTVGLAIGTSGLPCRAEKTAEQIRVAVQKSLPLLGKTGPIFFKKSACISCHNISLPSMAMVLADQYGFEVNQQARRDNIEAALNSDIFFEQKRLMKLDGVPGRTMTTGYTLMALAAEDYPADSFTSTLATWSAETQLADGSWRLPAHRTPIEYSFFTGTALGLRAIQLYGPPAKREQMMASINRARTWLTENAPHDNEGRTFRLLGLSWAQADSKLIEEAVNDLTDHQRDDGGWAQLAGLPSDAYATGQALYALRVGGGVPTAHALYRRGVEYLLETQLVDGTWLVETRSPPVQPYFESGFPHGPNQWISCAATSWATMALTYALDKWPSPAESDP